jgi:hypothetical protein
VHSTLRELVLERLKTQSSSMAKEIEIENLLNRYSHVVGKFRVVNTVPIKIEVEKGIEDSVTRILSLRLKGISHREYVVVPIKM